jgi:hypothetical protein
MTNKEKLGVAEAIAENCIDYIYETVATQLDWNDWNTDDDYDENKFMEAHDEVTRLTIHEIAKRLNNINDVSNLLTKMKQ